MNARSSLSRRSFLFLAGAGGVAGAVAIKSRGSLDKTKTPAATKERGEAYRETAHIRNYYRTTKI